MYCGIYLKTISEVHNIHSNITHSKLLPLFPGTNEIRYIKDIQNLTCMSELYDVCHKILRQLTKAWPHLVRIWLFIPVGCTNDLNLIQILVWFNWNCNKEMLKLFAFLIDISQILRHKALLLQFLSNFYSCQSELPGRMVICPIEDIFFCGNMLHLGWHVVMTSRSIYP